MSQIDKENSMGIINLLPQVFTDGSEEGKGIVQIKLFFSPLCHGLSLKGMDILSVFFLSSSF